MECSASCQTAHTPSIAQSTCGTGDREGTSPECVSRYAYNPTPSCAPLIPTPESRNENQQSIVHNTLTPRNLGSRDGTFLVRQTLPPLAPVGHATWHQLQKEG